MPNYGLRCKIDDVTHVLVSTSQHKIEIRNTVTGATSWIKPYGIEFEIYESNLGMNGALGSMKSVKHNLEQRKERKT
jgi:hypothetical protein